MRTSERVAVAAVIVMVLPALFVFPALGIWAVVRVWPELSKSQHGWFWLSLVTFCVAGPYVFRNRLDVFFRGRTKKLSLFEQALIFAPIVVGLWAVTHTWIALFGVLYAKFLFSWSRVEDLAKGKTEVIDVTRLVEPEEPELSLFEKTKRLLRRRRSTNLYPPIVARGRRKRSSRHDGRS